MMSWCRSERPRKTLEITGQQCDSDQLLLLRVANPNKKLHVSCNLGEWRSAAQLRPFRRANDWVAMAVLRTPHGLIEPTCMDPMTTFKSPWTAPRGEACLTQAGHLRHDSLGICAENAVERLLSASHSLAVIAAAHGGHDLTATETWRLSSWADRAAALVEEATNS